MDLSHLKYQKSQSGNKELKSVDRKKVRQESSGLNSGRIPVFKSTYLKKEGNRSSALVFVLSGGTTRERDFLKMLINQTYLHSLRVLFLSKEGQGLQPYQMEEMWRIIQKNGYILINGQTYHLVEMDKVYLLSDVDEFYSQLEKILKSHSDHNLGEWIISNPCIEMWLYYCFKNDLDNDLKDLVSLSTAERSQKLKEMGNSLVPGGLNPLKAFLRMPEGIVNSKSHFVLDENGIPVLFATQMHLFAEYIVQTLNIHHKEYDEYIQYKKTLDTEMKIIFGK